MSDINLEQLKYPIGRFEEPDCITDTHLKQWIETLETLPSRISKLVIDLNESQLEMPYRPGGWTLRQLVHHISDSHHNSYMRFKWALTEDNPVIKVYDEKEWASLFDSREAPITLSLNHLTAVHAKLVFLLKGLSKVDLKRTFIHPAGNVETSLEKNIGRYAWHGTHHYAHIEGLLKREGWIS